MNRRNFLLSASSLAAAGLAISPDRLRAAGMIQPPPANSPWPAPFDSAPTLQNPAADAITVVVAVKAACTAWVEYGPTPALGSRADGSQHGLRLFNARVHHIRLEDLSPGKKYFYRVVACPIDFKGPYKIGRGVPVVGETYSFTTLDEGAGPSTTFSVINDTHETPDTLRGVTAALAAANPSLTFWNGDIFNDIRSDEQIVSQLLRPAGAAYAATTPMCFVSGNHDVRGVHARCLDWFVPVPDGKRYRLMRQGPVAIVILDTGEDKPDDHPVYAGLNDFAAYRETQRRWLEKAVRSEAWRSASFRVAIMHIPLWGPGESVDSRRKWHPILQQAQVDVIINGHTHSYKYTPANADHAYAQLVGGGPKPEAATVIHARADTASLGLLVHDLSDKEIGNYEFKKR